MFKKLASILAAAMLTLAAGNAFASFTSTSDLYRVVLNSTGTVEIVTDLGSTATLLSSATSAGSTGYTVGGGADAFTNYATINSSTSGNYTVAYFSFTNGSPKVMYLSGSTTTASAITSNSGASALAVANSIVSGYNSVTGGTANTGEADGTSLANSYWKKADASTGYGQGASNGAFGGIVAAAVRSNTEASLAGLASGVTQELYYFSNANTAQTGTGVLTLVTNADGSTTLSVANAVSSTPIPPAFFLMGSGLLGMFGLRRKTA